jgi:hypothetical protein
MERGMTALAPDDVPESSTVGTARNPRIGAAREVDGRREAPVTPKYDVGLELQDHELPNCAERFGLGLEDDRVEPHPRAETEEQDSCVGYARSGFQPAGREDGRRLERPTTAEAPPSTA